MSERVQRMNGTGARVASTYNALSAGERSGKYLDAIAGIAALVLGVYLLVAPLPAADVLVRLVAVVLLVEGVATIIGASRAQDPTRGWRIIGGLFAVVAALIVLAFPAFSTLISVAMVFFVLAAGVLIAGVIEIASGLRAAPRSWFRVLVGILLVGFGVLLILNPTVGAVIVVQVLGALAIALGIALLASWRLQR